MFNIFHVQILPITSFYLHFPERVSYRRYVFDKAIAPSKSYGPIRLQLGFLETKCFIVYSEVDLM